MQPQEIQCLLCRAWANDFGVRSEREISANYFALMSKQYYYPVRLLGGAIDPRDGTNVEYVVGARVFSSNFINPEGRVVANDSRFDRRWKLSLR